MIGMTGMTETGMTGMIGGEWRDSLINTTITIRMTT